MILNVHVRFRFSTFWSYQFFFIHWPRLCSSLLFSTCWATQMSSTFQWSGWQTFSFKSVQGHPPRPLTPPLPPPLLAQLVVLQLPPTWGHMTTRNMATPPSKMLKYSQGLSGEGSQIMMWYNMYMYHWNTRRMGASTCTFCRAETHLKRSTWTYWSCFLLNFPWCAGVCFMLHFGEPSSTVCTHGSSTPCLVYPSPYFLQVP